MGNKKFRLRRNKKCNNWKAMLNKKKMKNAMENIELYDEEVS